MNRDQPDTLRTLGVTGGIGSGKSVVCAELRKIGAEVFAADRVARELLERDAAVRQDVTDAFGAQSYRQDGALNRSDLAERVFGDEVALRQLNSIVHPRVREAFQAAAAKCEAPLLVHEAALIYEAGLETYLNAVAVVYASQADRIRWVMARDKVTESQVRLRMRHQLSSEETVGRADVVITNSGPLDDLRRKARRLYGLATRSFR